MQSLLNDLILKGVSPSSAQTYVKKLYILNDSAPFGSLAFLRDVDPLYEKIMSKGSRNTQKTLLCIIISSLETRQGIAGYNVLLSAWKEKFTHFMTEFNNTKGERDKKIQERMISPDEISAIKENLMSQYDDMSKHTVLASQKKKFSLIQDAFLLSLYTDIPARRNDYIGCIVVHNPRDAEAKDRNYLILPEKRFVFNVYKTAKKYGAEEINYGKYPVFQTYLDEYLSNHPLKRSKSFALLVREDGLAWTQSNCITRKLNGIFKRYGFPQIGSSILRHIYITDKYGNISEGQRELAKEMGHSVGTQNLYAITKK
jgi:integrase